MTVRQAAYEVELCRDTSFRWLHRFLTNVQAHQPAGVTELLEVDESYSRKAPGRPRGRRVNGVAKPRAKDNGAEVTDALKKAVVTAETVVCTDGRSAFFHFQ